MEGKGVGRVEGKVVGRVEGKGRSAATSKLRLPDLEKDRYFRRSKGIIN